MALSRESTTYPRWISRASSGSGVRNKRKRTPIQCFCGVPRKKEGVLPVGNTSDRRSRRQEGMRLISHIFVRTRKHFANTHNFFFSIFVSRDNKKTRVSRYVAAASSASSASMTALSPPMSRITCVGCAAPGGAGVPAGFTHTDARSAASTPPCGGGGAKRRKKRRQSRRARQCSARLGGERLVTNGRANDETRGHAVLKKGKKKKSHSYQ